MNSMDRILTEAMVRKALKDMKDSPARGARNLVDLGLLFARGPFQRYFLKSLQEIMKNEDSPYYRLVEDTVSHVDQDRLLTFSMNLGYNSCTYGAKTIRQIEKEQHFDIPWAMFLEAGEADSLPDTYDPVICQGNALGIYTWFLFSRQQTAALLSLAAEHRDNAFALFCDAEEITEDLMERAAGINNIMFVVRYGADADDACRILREHRMLYALCLIYTSADVPKILSGEYLDCAQALHPVFAAAIAMPDCSEDERKAVFTYLCGARESQCFQVVPWDCVYDSCSIDSVISEDPCSAGFNAAGHLITMYQQRLQDECNLFLHSLREILRFTFPKVSRT